MFFDYDLGMTNPGSLLKLIARLNVHSFLAQFSIDCLKA
ncbi:hypothetical protein CFter6_0056 [Collimonas fungivorans]|uniref:Uncharacterized protein n=1 Tax=Collimonas fungivorans TaxID=158899 RepID=A0A127P4W1_9BURK|nr:hypothetical protein CFter6_0056 [Collimonas fungivorans]